MSKTIRNLPVGSVKDFEGRLEAAENRVEKAKARFGADQSGLNQDVRALKTRLKKVVKGGMVDDGAQLQRGVTDEFVENGRVQLGEKVSFTPYSKKHLKRIVHKGIRAALKHRLEDEAKKEIDNEDA